MCRCCKMLVKRMAVPLSIKVLTLLIYLAACNDDIVDYYEKLINEEIARASTYQFPKDASEYKPTNVVPLEFGIYDFVVIGGGSAGSVVASRLSENRQSKVLLLEAGTEENNFTDIPSMSAYTVGLEYNWGFNSTPQTTCCLAMDGVCPFPRGRSLGGTSAINALIYCRGNRLDYDRWAAEGNRGWSYKDVLPYFKKSEDSHIDGDPGYHGTGGDLNVNYHYPLSTKVDVFINANKELGTNPGDYNGKDQFRASRMQYTTTDGRRESSAKAFLGPARNRPNLKILTNSYVTRILVSKLTKAAHGVLFSHRNVEYVVKVRNEVVLSAGLVGSPQILMLSGIGPADHLRQHGIPVLKDLAVGVEMRDHLTFYNMYFSSTRPEPAFTLREAIKQYLNGTGPLTVATNPQGVAFHHLAFDNSSAPDIEVVIVPSMKSSGFDAVARGAVHGHTDQTYTNYSAQDYILQIVTVLLHPKTKGRVYLQSKNPYDYPLIESKCLADSNNEDLKDILKAIKLVLKLTKTDAFEALNATLLPYPSCASHNFLSEDYWTCVVRQTAMNAYHGIGTCKMGPDPQKGAVVDNKLRVHGIQNLRIADTSVIPVTLSAHMNAPAMMIGERVADFIKEDNNWYHYN